MVPMWRAETSLHGGRSQSFPFIFCVPRTTLKSAGLAAGSPPNELPGWAQVTSLHLELLFKGYLTHLIKRSSVNVRIANVLVIIRKVSSSLILFSLVIETLQEGNPTVFRLGNQGLVWTYIHNGRSHEFCEYWELNS